ncbi:DoxX family protein [Fluviispira vulneris]|uniref:DoxX family protein n=1 Tax=Fluviispira vulneris TaxID=2763012 RepID=UPI0016453D49|nr:DoxX family protein [Fluviispira vulneris]
MKNNKINYLHNISTFSLALPMFIFSILLIFGAPPMLDTLRRLGYEAYFAHMLGGFKFIGSIALIQKKYPRLKEHAYAGFCFDYIAAIVSHINAKDPFFIILAPIIAICILTISYLSWSHRVKLTEIFSR